MTRIEKQPGMNGQETGGAKGNALLVITRHASNRKGTRGQFQFLPAFSSRAAIMLDLCPFVPMFFHGYILNDRVHAHNPPARPFTFPIHSSDDSSDSFHLSYRLLGDAQFSGTRSLNLYTTLLLVQFESYAPRFWNWFPRSSDYVHSQSTYYRIALEVMW